MNILFKFIEIKYLRLVDGRSIKNLRLDGFNDEPPMTKITLWTSIKLSRLGNVFDASKLNAYLKNSTIVSRNNYFYGKYRVFWVVAHGFNSRDECCITLFSRQIFR